VEVSSGPLKRGIPATTARGDPLWASFPGGVSTNPSWMMFVLAPSRSGRVCIVIAHQRFWFGRLYQKSVQRVALPSLTPLDHADFTSSSRPPLSRLKHNQRLLCSMMIAVQCVHTVLPLGKKDMLHPPARSILCTHSWKWTDRYLSLIRRLCHSAARNRLAPSEWIINAFHSSGLQCGHANVGRSSKIDRCGWPTSISTLGDK
jgi:hypothetical protein